MTTPPDFDALYAGDADPYRVASSWYEQRKLRVVLALLTAERYAAAWDPFCGTGHLAAALAERCDTVLGTDLAPSAIDVARRTCLGVDGVRLAVHRLPAPPPDVDHRFDLVVLAESLYYLESDDRSATLDLVDGWTTTDAEVLAVHWRHDPHDAYLGGAAVQHEIVERLGGRGWAVRAHLDDTDFVIDVLRRVGGQIGPAG